MFEYYNLLQGFAELVQTGETAKIVTEGGEIVNDPKRGVMTLPKVSLVSRCAAGHVGETRAHRSLVSGWPRGWDSILSQ